MVVSSICGAAGDGRLRERSPAPDVVRLGLRPGESVAAAESARGTDP